MARQKRRAFFKQKAGAEAQARFGDEWFGPWDRGKRWAPAAGAEAEILLTAIPSPRRPASQSGAAIEICFKIPRSGFSS